MTFAEKLTFLLQLTSTTNKQLAEAVNLDPSLISRYRRARRDVPKNFTYIRVMADYFARKCEKEYQRIALSDALGRKQLQLQMESEQLAAVLFDWLTDSRDQVGQFFNTFERFAFKTSESGETDTLSSLPKSDSNGSFAYYGNDGKRGAVSTFISYVLSVNKPGTILLSHDESTEWLFEDPVYLQRLQDMMLSLLQRGFRICRLAAPLHGADAAFDSLSRWLPLYMTGQVEAFYYPRLRDDMYRRTLIVLPDVAAVVSTSTGNQQLAGATIFTQDRRLVGAFVQEYQNLLAKCRPMMVTYSTALNSAALLRCIAQYDSDRGRSIAQSTTLSSLTAPAELVDIAVASMSESEADAVRSALARSRKMFCQNLREYESIDIHSIASAEEIRSGTVPIGIGYLSRDASLCYTPETYILHLQSILHYIETYDNYRAVLIPCSNKTHALLVKEGRQALLLRPGIPLTVFEVSQLSIAEACREYLLRIIESLPAAERQRYNIVSSIRQLISELKKS